MTENVKRRDILLVPGLTLQMDEDGFWFIFVIPTGQRSRVLIGEHDQHSPAVEWAKDFVEND